MALTLEDGTGVEGANCYVSLAQANAYFETHPRAAAWADLSDPEKTAYLIHATRTIDVGVTWKGERVEIEQALEWPRANVTVDGKIWPDDVIPSDLRNAVCECAVGLAVSGLRDGDSQSAGIQSIGLGSGALNIVFDPKTEKDLLGKLAPLFVGRFIFGSGQRRVVPVVRV
jgi:hypothetical protein